MRARPTRLVAAVCLFLLATPLTACADEADAGRDRLARARTTWAAAGVADYDLAVRYGCFCPFAGVVRVEVRAGTATVTDVDLVDETVGTATPEGTPTTVEELLDLVARMLATSEKVTVTYDERGVPTTIEVDQIVDAIDDELAWTAAVTPR